MRIFFYLIAIFSFTVGCKVKQEEKVLEQAVVVHFFKYGSKDLSRIFDLEKRLESSISNAKVGMYDGNEIALDGGDGFLYMYGPDADKLFETVRPIFNETPFLKGAEVKKRYGPPNKGFREVVFILGSE